MKATAFTILIEAGSGFVRLLAFATALFPVFEMNGQPEEGLVASFSFNKGSVVDDRGRFAGKAYGAPLTADRFGNDGFAYYLMGNPDSYINLGTDPKLKCSKGTVSIWLSIEEPLYKGKGVEQNPVITMRAHAVDSFNEAFHISYHFNLRKLNVNNTLSKSNQVSIYPVQTTNLREWYHAAITYDDNQLSFYLNGKLQGKGAKNFSTRFLEGDSIIIGKREGTANRRYFQGYVDDIMIYDRVLSPAEIMELYEAPNPNRLAVFARWVLVLPGVLALFLFGRWFVKKRVAHALSVVQAKNDLLHRSYEQEIRTLKTQMNPHFIFNALNSIQQFIITNQNETAQMYLSKFSKLIRRTLESSTADSLTLHDEIAMLKGYIEIESLRFNNVFEYRISLSDQLENTTISIPHLLIQPFVENSIWHGLLPKKGHKLLEITFDLVNEHTLGCVVEDNGVGRHAGRGDKLDGKGHSLATELVQQRLDLMSKLTKRKYGIRITDKISNSDSAGTRVEIELPILEKHNHATVSYH
jgi:hypothetical protein